MQVLFETVLSEALTLTPPDKARLIERLAATLHGAELPDQSETMPADWLAFIQQTAGSLSHDPLQRWPEGDFEIREAID